MLPHPFKRALTRRTGLLVVSAVAILYALNVLGGRPQQISPPAAVPPLAPEAKEAFIQLELGNEVDGPYDSRRS